MQLTNDERNFLTDPENWQYGPSYDLTMQFDSGVTSETILERLLSLPGVIPWQVPDKDGTLLIVHCANLLNHPVGMMYYTWTLQQQHISEVHHCLVLYPRQFIQICGSYPHFYLPEEFRRAETVRLHAVLLWLVDMLNQAFPLCGACLSDGTYGAQFAPGQFLLLKDTATYLGVQGECLTDDFTTPGRPFHSNNFLN